MFLLVFTFIGVGGCAALLDGHYVSKDGKESPFKPSPDKYAPTKDPTLQN